VAVDGKVVYQQPSWAVVHAQSGTVMELGKKAALMIGKTPQHVSVVSPLARGYITDQVIIEWYLNSLLYKVVPNLWWKGPLWQSTAYVSVPSETPEVEKELWLKVWQQLGFGKVRLVQKKHSLHAWFLEGPGKQSSRITVVIDSGSGSTEVVMVCGKEVLAAKTLPLGGQDISQAIMKSILKDHACDIGMATVEKLKLNIRGRESIKSTIRGKNVLTGLPTTVVVENQTLIEVAMKVLKPVGQTIKEMMTTLPTESFSQTDQLNVVLAGGNGLLWGFDLYVESLLKASVTKSANPGDEVIKGLQIVSAV
jgi:rod shape-determining protein MreB